MPDTPAPTSATAPRARSTACVLLPVSSTIACWPCVTTPSCCASACTFCACAPAALMVSSIAPRTCAASRPSVEASRLMSAISRCASSGGAGCGAAGSTCAGAGFFSRLNMENRTRWRPLGSPLPQLAAQACDRLAVQLADAALGDAEHGGDLLEIHVVLVVHAHH